MCTCWSPISQLSVRERAQADLEAEARDLRSELTAVRAELASSEDALARAASHYELQLAQRLPAGGSLRESRGAHGSGPPSPLASSSGGRGGVETEHSEAVRMAQQLIAERAETEQRHSAKLCVHRTRTHGRSARLLLHA